MAHGVYSTLDATMAKNPRLGVLLFFCFVLCHVVFFLDKINHTANSCAGRGTRNIMNPGLAGRMGQHLLAIVRAIFYNRQRVPHRVALNPNHSEQWKSVVGNRFLVNQSNAKTPTVQRSIGR